MNCKSIRYTLLFLLFAVGIVLEASAQTDITPVSTKTRWLMGYGCVQENSSVDVVLSSTKIPAFKGTEVHSNMKLNCTNKSRIIHEEDYLYGSSALSLAIKVSGNGRLTIKAQRCNTDGVTATGKARDVTVKLGGSTVETVSFSNGSNPETFSVTVENVTDSNNELTITTSDHIRWYSIQWTPEGTAKETPTLSISMSSTGAFYVDDEARLVTAATVGGNPVALSGISYTVTEGTGVISVDADGNVTGLKGGTAKVQASFAGDDDYNSCVSNECTITVNKLDLESVIKVDGVEVAHNSTLNVTVGDKPHITLDYSYGGEPISIDPMFSSNNTGVLGYENQNQGKMSALSAGQANVTIYSKNNDKFNNKYNALTFVVTQASPEIKTADGSNPTTLGGAALGLDVETPVDLAGRFKVMLGTTDVTSQGSLSYSSGNLTVNGTTLSSTTQRNDGNLTVTWTPYDNNKYNTVSVTISDIQVARAALKELDMTVSPATIDNLYVGDSSSAISVQYSFGGNPVSLSTTFTSADETIATVSTSGVVTGVKGGSTSITVAFAGDDTYKAVSRTVDVTVKRKTVTMTADPASIEVEENTSKTINITFSPSVTLSPLKFTSADVNKATVNSAGKVMGAVQGSTTITVKFEGDDEYEPCQTSVSVKVTDNPMFEYLGYKLEGNMTGDLKDRSTPANTLLHYKFGAPEKTDIYVFKLNSKDDVYEFANDKLILKSEAQTCENNFDNFYMTKLTENGGGGDAFTEYNGMMGGYGTENGGRYLTPIGGTFIRVEPLYDGVVTVTLRHNGGTDASSFKGDVDNVDGCSEVRVARRPLYVMDEDGKIMPRTSNYAQVAAGNAELTSIDGTYAFIKTNSEINTRFDVINAKYSAWMKNPTDANAESLGLGKGYDKEFSKNAFAYIKNVIYGDVSDFENTIKSKHNQKLHYSAYPTDVEYQTTGASEKTKFFAKYGYEVLSATQLSLSFPVEAGKTYFVGANKSKVGLCTIEFTRTQSNTALTPYTLDEDAPSTPDWIKNTSTGTNINVKLKRTFRPGQWHPLVLPFSVSESTLREKFGDNVSVIALDGSLKMLSSMNNYATRDAGAKASADGRPFTGSVIKDPAVKDGAVTFTRHYYQMIYANCPVFICPDPALTSNIVDPVFNNVTFVKPTLNSYDEIVLPWEVDRQIGDGEHYFYSMVAMYHATTAAQNTSREMYYVSNTGTGSSAVATLYHAEPGNAPAMKGMRVWIEPAADRYHNLPIRTIKMAGFNEADGSTTAIEDIVCDAPQDSMTGDDTVYDISGRAVARGTFEGLAPGVYIYQGRKHYIK